jgi:hypothetical protein
MLRSRPALDAVVVLWVVLWVWAGISVGHEVRRLADLSDTGVQLGQAVVDIGDAVGGLPLVGGQLGGSVRAAGREAIASAESTRTRTRRLGLLLGASIAIIPNLPLLLFYLPRRIAVERERRALLRALADEPRARLDELLARRAIAHLPYYLLRQVSADPAGDLAAGRHAALAEAELRRLGLHRRAAG